MTVPPEYGGHGRSALERYVVVEELLAAGAPVAAHWVSDRQIVPNLLRYGCEELKRRYLPAIARGACYFAIGLSEPDAGSDLAAVRTAATRADGGWIVSGVKIWTSGAHRAHALIALLRTGPADGRQRHVGLSQLLIELDRPGVTRAAPAARAARAARAAKAQASHSAGIVAAIAHQLHGAIGTTEEHRLRLTTTRLWSWRDEDGPAAECFAELGREALGAATGVGGLWPWLTGGPGW